VKRERVVDDGRRVRREREVLLMEEAQSSSEANLKAWLGGGGGAGGDVKHDEARLLTSFCILDIDLVRHAL